MAQDDDDTRRWKQKYYDNLEQLEKKEKQWREVEGLLRRGITRLSLAAGGADTALDRELDTLRAALRDGRDSLALRGVIESVGDSVARLDRRRASAPNLPGTADNLAQLLDELQLPRGMGRRIKTLHKRLQEHKPHADITPLLREFAALVQEALSPGMAKDAPPQSSDQAASKAAAASGPGDDSGLLRRLLGRSRRAEPVQDSETIVPSVQAPKSGIEEVLLPLLDKLPLPQERTVPLRRRVSDELAQAELQRLLDDIASAVRATCSAAQPVTDAQEVSAAVSPVSASELLIQLIELLDFPEGLAEKSEQLKQRLEEGALEQKAHEALEEIAALVVEARVRVQREKDEIEAFLQQLTVRLLELDVHVQGTEKVRVETRQSGVALDAAVQAQMQGMEAGIRNATEVAQLKQIIQSRIDAIRTHLEQHRHAQEERNTRAEQQVQQLTQKLRGLEAETDTLRSRIAQEHALAFKDGLTEVGNQLAYRERIEQEYTRWKRYQSPLVLLVWDVDRFKHVNDTYGHKAGDKALKTIAELLQKNLRATDFLARYGGEEFVILMPETSLSDATPVAEKLRAAIESSGFHYREQHVPITISCGMAEFRGGDTPETVFSRADSAMYRAKKAGGNQCMADTAP